MEKIAVQDLEHILSHTSGLWRNIKGKTFFITGGTGFFGKWLLSSFIYINDKKKLGCKAIILTRNKNLFLKNYPHYNKPELSFIEGDITSFKLPQQQIDYIIHAATEANVSLNLNEPLLMFNTIIEGTKRVLELARIKNVKSVLHTSSGAVYGEQPSAITHLTEDYVGAPDPFNPGAAYGEGKRVAEMLSSVYYRQYGIQSKIARCYAFVGPHLPLDTHFAVGNFIKSIIDGDNIVVKGDGTPYRSYLYAADLTIWLWTILFLGKTNHAYNVGSDVDISIEDLAVLASSFSLNTKVKILGKKVPCTNVKRYVPSISKAKAGLNLDIYINLEDAIKRTLKFYNYE